MAIRFFTTVTAIVALLGSMLTSSSIFAQEEQRLEEITVVAPRISREVQERTRPPYGKVIIEEGRALVQVADLDLTTKEGMAEVEKRVSSAAERICNELEEKLPFGQPSTPVCIQRAVEDTMAELKELSK